MNSQIRSLLKNSQHYSMLRTPDVTANSVAVFSGCDILLNRNVNVPIYQKNGLVNLYKQCKSVCRLTKVGFGDFEKLPGCECLFQM